MTNTRKVMTTITYVIIFMETLLLLCHGKAFSIQRWNRCFPNITRELMNIQLTTCIFECKIRAKCMAVQYQRVRRSCGILTSSFVGESSLIECRNYVIIEKSEMDTEPVTCDPFVTSDLTGECITECHVPKNPSLYSTILGQPFIGNKIKITCDATFLHNGTTAAICKEDGTFDSLPRCELSEISSDINLALGRRAQISSIFLSYKAALALDGNPDGNMSHGSCAHSRTNLRPWFVVDLEYIYRIKDVVIYFRTDCCYSRLNNLHIFVSMNEKELISNEPWDAGTLCAMKDGAPTSVNENPLRFSCLSHVQGRFVKLILGTRGIIEFCELQIYGKTL